jgi:hypothetical protein
VLIETTEDGLEVVRFPPSPLVYRKRVINVGAFYFTLEANGDPRAGLLLPSDGAPIVIEAGGSAVIMWDDEDERYRVNAPPEEV